jgi:hypothetical protein
MKYGEEIKKMPKYNITFITSGKVKIVEISPAFLSVEGAYNYAKLRVSQLSNNLKVSINILSITERST